MHGGYLRRSSERMVKRNREMKRKQKEMSEEEDIDPEESARICFLRAENKRLLKVKETEKMALQKQIDDHNEEKAKFVELMAKQMRASCLEMERQLQEKAQQHTEEQKRVFTAEMMEIMKGKAAELRRQREMEIQEREAQKKKMELEMEQLRKPT